MIGAALGIIFSTEAKKFIMAVQLDFGIAERRKQLQQSPPAGSIAMIGDSQIARGKWNRLLGPDFANYGIAGDTTAGVLRRLGDITGTRAILLIGVNDITRGEAVETIAANIAAIIERLPMPVTVLSIMPLGEDLHEYNPAVLQVNALIGKSCRPPHCTFVDTWPAMAIDGKLNPRFTSDDLHLDADGYDVLARLIIGAAGEATSGAN
ncbi:GDSL-type esterase/lipase family protein [Roseiarcaceae bacterium H3SJ34-1]|uniref:GDSL-type esterase/lipase family protein n=1 Tax=Terripilifer ovatus TaxID=3032367 RepID=UPI003AB9873E|nr:GDSL-type esterase/lipase family protein [Roseiarcaceae bacterium H3SJ34-1]